VPKGVGKESLKMVKLNDRVWLPREITVLWCGDSGVGMMKTPSGELCVTTQFLGNIAGAIPAASGDSWGMPVVRSFHMGQHIWVCLNDMFSHEDIEAIDEIYRERVEALGG